MSKRRVVITAVLAGQSQSEVSRSYGVSQGWISKLMARYRLEGEAAFEPRSRARKTLQNATPPETVELVLRLRKQLDDAGLDAGADTIGWHLTHHHATTLSRARINRILTRAGAVTPEPQKRPKNSYTRFEATQPNETWQFDFTHYRLTDGTRHITHRTPTRPDKEVGRTCEMQVRPIPMTRYITRVPPAGFEPAHMASEANALSPELRERLLAYRNPVVPGNCHGAS